MRVTQFRHHFAENVIQIGAVRHVIHQRTVLVAERVPVVSVHVFGIEEVPIAPVDLVEHLDPFLVRNPVDHQPVGGDGLGA